MIPCAPYHRKDPLAMPGDFSLPGMMNPAVRRTASRPPRFRRIPALPGFCSRFSLYNKKVWPSQVIPFSVLFRLFPGFAPEQSRCPAVVLLPPPEGFLPVDLPAAIHADQAVPFPHPGGKSGKGQFPPFHRQRCCLRSGQSPAWFFPPYRSCSGSPLSLSTHRETPSVVMRISPSRSVR